MKMGAYEVLVEALNRLSPPEPTVCNCWSRVESALEEAAKVGCGDQEKDMGEDRAFIVLFPDGSIRYVIDMPGYDLQWQTVPNDTWRNLWNKSHANAMSLVQHRVSDLQATLRERDAEAQKYREKVKQETEALKHTIALIAPDSETLRRLAEEAYQMESEFRRFLGSDSPFGSIKSFLSDMLKRLRPVR